MINYNCAFPASTLTSVREHYAGQLLDVYSSRIAREPRIRHYSVVAIRGEGPLFKQTRGRE